MKKLLFLLTVTLALASCTKERITGRGATVNETRTIAAFTKVRIEGSCDVTISPSATQSVKVFGYENLVPIFRTNVHNGTLILKYDDDVQVRNNNISVIITIPELNSVAINGSGNFDVANFTGTSFSADINGSGKIEMVNSTYNTANYRINGSGHIKGAGLRAKEVDANISGSGTIDVFTTEKLIARISGSGTINYWGNPAAVETQVSGSGKVNKR